MSARDERSAPGARSWPASLAACTVATCLALPLRAQPRAPATPPAVERVAVNAGPFTMGADVSGFRGADDDP